MQCASNLQALDEDKDGFITLADVQRHFEQNTSLYEPLVLRTESEIAADSQMTMCDITQTPLIS